MSASLQVPRTVEVEVHPVIVVAFSEPLDPATVHDGSVAVVPWDVAGGGESGSGCALAPRCERGQCERGRCLEDPLSDADLSALDRGEFASASTDRGGVAIELTLGPGGAGPDSRVDIRPTRPLAPHWRHAVVIGAGVRDVSGAPLVVGGPGTERAGAWRRDFVTAHEGSSGPEPRLVAPAADRTDVPTNVARIETAFARPVAREDGATLYVEAPGGRRVALVEPVACAGWVPDFCLSWRVDGPLEPDAPHRLVGGTLLDRAGRSARIAGVEEFFWTGEGPDTEPPVLANQVAVEAMGRCVHVSVSGIMGDTVQVTTPWGTIAGAPGVSEFAVRVPASAGVAPGDELTASVQATDLAGNATATTVHVTAGPGMSADVPELALVEILANPAGPEPAQEFVELLDLREAGDPREAVGLYLADRTWPEVRAQLEAGGEPPGDALPAFTTAPGERVVIVGGGYAASDPADPGPAAGATVIRLDSSLAENGLSNAGEPLTLYAPAAGSGPALVSAVASPPTVAGSGHAGRSVVAVMSSPAQRGCDRPGGWISHPLGTASPGFEP